MTLKNSYLGAELEELVELGELLELGGTDCMRVIVPVTVALGKKVRFCFAIGASAGECERGNVAVRALSHGGAEPPTLTHSVDGQANSSPQLPIRSNSSHGPIAVRFAISAAAPAFSAVTYFPFTAMKLTLPSPL